MLFLYSLSATRPYSLQRSAPILPFHIRTLLPQTVHHCAFNHLTLLSRIHFPFISSFRSSDNPERGTDGGTVKVASTRSASLDASVGGTGTVSVLQKKKRGKYIYIYANPLLP